MFMGIVVGNDFYVQGGWYYSGGVSIVFFGMLLIIVVLCGLYEIRWIGWRGGWDWRKEKYELES